MRQRCLQRPLAMARVTDVEDPEAPTVLLVDNNQMALHRLSAIFRQREFLVVECEDGDKAVDEYIRLDPELVVMSLEIPSLDGHLAALEMREHGGECRIIFTAPRHQAELAHDATHSAGALGWIEKPVSASAFDAIWNKVEGPVPDAPGLDDLDTIHPDADLEKIEIEEDDGEFLLPVLPPLNVITELEISSAENPIVVKPVANTATKKKSSKGKRLIIVLTIFAGLAAAGWYAWKEGLLQL